MNGIVPGGGLALLHAEGSVHELSAEEPDEGFGVQIVHEALSEPLRQLLANAGVRDVAEVMEEVRRRGASVGFDVNRFDYCDLNESGIIDASRMIELALRRASDLAGMCLTVVQRG